MLTLQFVPYSSIEGLSSLGRIKRLLKMAKENKIVLLEGRLKKEEEAELIKATMEEINASFKGIELAVLNPESKGSSLGKFRNELAGFLLGDRTGLTIIGPASIVKAIKRDPNKIELLTRKARSSSKKTARKRKK